MPHCHSVPWRVNFLSGSTVVAKSGRNRALKLTRPRKLRSSATLVGAFVSQMALTFSSVGPTPCLFRISPMNTIWLILILHLSLLRVRFLYCNLFSKTTRFLSCSSVVLPCTTMSSAILLAPGHPAIVCLTMFWYCSGALFIPKLNLL